MKAVLYARVSSEKQDVDLSISAQLKASRDKGSIEKYIADMHSLIETNELVKRKAFIRSFVKEITVTGSEASLVYTMPELEKAIGLEEEVVLPIVHDGGEAGI
jgi:predicted site-specific integrase-resolvase